MSPTINGKKFELRLTPPRALLGAIAAAILTSVAPAAAQGSRLDSLDAFVKVLMTQRNVRGLSLAIIKDGRIALARAYGVVDDVTNAPVTSSTLFLAGSISKPVSAIGALHLVEAGTLSLDDDVNAKLATWKVPENRFTVNEKVTLRRLLSHRAGLTVHGFPGYDVSDRMPTLVQVLNGAPPANTAPIRVDTTPGAIQRYSGGGFTVVQQLMIDVTGQSFAQFMQRSVLAPIGMTSSSFEQPLPAPRATLAASGYFADGTPVRGRWHAYPELAAAGLWTTPTDLAKFAIEIQETLAGRGHGVVSAAMAREYLTGGKGDGLGVNVEDISGTVRFNHGGRDAGFDALLEAGAVSGDGFVIMINANDNSRFMKRVRAYIARAWSFPDAPAAPTPTATTPVRIERSRLTKYAGYYEEAENAMILLAANEDGSGMQVIVDGRPDENLLTMDSTTFGSSDRSFLAAFATDRQGVATEIVLRFGQQPARRAPRVAPLASSLEPTTDPDPALAGRISAALAVLRQGGSALASAPDVTPGAKRDFAGGGIVALEGAATARYLGEENVEGRGIRRHGAEVTRVRMYSVQSGAGQRYLFVHLTAAGTLTDYDIVLR